ncbi:MAG: hypothetical protein HYW28_13800, partial [Rhodospirillales bacterium]|nr:hypothetical protein [Rhodospirillales bacterium]
VTHGAEVYAFVIGTGLIRTSEEHLGWQVVSNGFGANYILHLAAAPTRAQQLYVATVDPATHTQAILVSPDGGAHWVKLGVE